MKNFTFALHQSRTSSGLRIPSLPLPFPTLAPLLALSDFHSCATHLNCASCSKASAVCLIRSRAYFEIGACCESSEKEKDCERVCMCVWKKRMPERRFKCLFQVKLKLCRKKQRGKGRLRWGRRVQVPNEALTQVFQSFSSFTLSLFFSSLPPSLY